MKKKQITSAEISWAKWQSCIKTCRSAAWLLSIKVRAILDGKRPWTTRQTPTRLRTTRKKKVTQLIAFKCWTLSMMVELLNNKQYLLHVLLKNHYHKLVLPEPKLEPPIPEKSPSSANKYSLDLDLRTRQHQGAHNSSKPCLVQRSERCTRCTPWNWRM